MKKILKFLVKTVKWTFIVFLLFIGSLFFREQRIPATWIVSAVSSRLPESLVFECDSAAVGFRNGARIGGVRLYDKERADPLKPLVAAQRVSVDFLARRVRVEALKIPRLHDGYYKPGNMERNERIDVELPKLPSSAGSRLATYISNGPTSTARCLSTDSAPSTSTRSAWQGRCTARLGRRTSVR